MPALIAQLFAVFGPIVMDLIRQYQASHNGALPTDAQLTEQFNANIQKYLAAGDTWTAAHPRPSA